MKKIHWCKGLILILTVLMVVGCRPTTNDKIEGEGPATDVQKLDSSAIDSQGAMALIEEFSSKAYTGRQAGTPGNTKAEAYLSDLYDKLGLQAAEGLESYLQTYTQKAVFPVQATEISVIGTDFSLAYQDDFTERMSIDIAYYDLEFQGQMVFVDDVNLLKKDMENLHNKVILMTEEVLYDSNRRKYMNALIDQGINVEALIVPREDTLRISRAVYGNPDADFDAMNPAFIACTYEAFNALKGFEEEGRDLKISMDFTAKEVEVSNIVGVIPGKNAIGEDETLIIGAHMDHLGTNLNGTYNPGALDNASGVSVMMELARLFSQADQPEDTIVFVAFNGEEDGLYGSEYFVNNPPLDYNPETTRMLNLDMVGSSGDVPLEISIYNYDSLSMRKEMSEFAQDLDIDYVVKTQGSSDHMSFAQKDIESLMLIHFDQAYYHTYEDTIDNAVDQGRLEDVIKLSVAFVNSIVYQ